MSRELFILRHAKSDWDSGASTDSERPLNKRGRKEAPRIGAWMREQDLMPAQVYCSTAVRARETLQAVAKELHLPAAHIHFMDELYLADLRTLLRILAEIPQEHTSAMLVGHNPGLDDLVSHLSHQAVPLTASGKLMTTACLAHFRLPDDWHALARTGELLRIIRPADLD
ncbi:MAG: histidine phosphatase family protein [Gammaproteobacteria bacterium]|nr:histidine phosphatase family protein [Gammaproteobacteria bacterium]